MAIAKKNTENKFAQAVAALDEQEAVSRKKSDKVVKSIAGDKKPGRRKVEERKALPTYIPVSLYEEFDAITAAYGISNNAAICQLIRDYVEEKRSILEK